MRLASINGQFYIFLGSVRLYSLWQKIFFTWRSLLKKMKMSRLEFHPAYSSSSILIKISVQIFRCRRWWLIRWLTALESTPLVVQSLWFLQDNPLPLLVKSEDFLDQNKCTKLYGFHILLPFLKNKDRDGTSVIDLIHQTSHYKIWSISQLVKITFSFEEFCAYKSANFFKVDQS